MNHAHPPVAARNEISAADIQSDANLKVGVGAPTKRFHLWVQGPAWLLGFAALGLGFLMVLTGYDSGAGWFAVSTGVLLAVIASFRAPFTVGESAISSAPGKPRRKPAAPTSPPPAA
ncbi:MAG: hypothetical protein ABSB24_02350 [Gaiellaceae bacterium]|jgi:hypothetical protein